MEIKKISLKEYMNFSKSIYKNDNNFKDNKSGTIEIVCDANRPFFSRSKVEIIAVKENEKIFCSCVLIIHKNAPKMLCVGFFESLPNCQKAVELLINYATNFGKQNRCKKLVIALDGHINISVAFTSGEGIPAFGESYCPQYYHDYFANFDKVKFTSFYDDIDLVKSRIANDLPKLDKIKTGITLEYADFASGFTDTMKRYTDLNNEIFVDHKYYFHREYDEDYDLFKDMKPLLKNENLIFARCDNKDIGFILWYPDYNELVKVSKGASIITFIKYKIFNQNPKTSKVVEIGVSERYRQFGTVLLLLNEALQWAGKNTRKILSSWILDENIKSKLITQRYTQKYYKDYFTYEKEL